MTSDVSGLRYEEKMEGSIIKSSTIEYTWEFILDTVPQKIKLIDSKWTGVKRLFKNDIETSCLSS